MFSKAIRTYGLMVILCLASFLILSELARFSRTFQNPSSAAGWPMVLRSRS